MIEFLEAIRDFTETGGQVLLVIGLLIFVMWLLILERAMYLMVWHKKKQKVKRWQAGQHVQTALHGLLSKSVRKRFHS